MENKDHCMRIVIDSNIFYPDPFFRSTRFKILFEGLKLLPGLFYIPEIVIDELVNHYKEELNGALGSGVMAGRTCIGLKFLIVSVLTQLHITHSNIH
jgi:predicted nucleic acid-binding protein